MLLSNKLFDKNFCLQDFVLDLATLYLFLGKDMSDVVFVLINYSIDLISDRHLTAGILISSVIPVKDHFCVIEVVPGQFCYP